MTDYIKISDLDEVTNIESDMYLEVEQLNTSKKISATTLVNEVAALGVSESDVIAMIIALG